MKVRLPKVLLATLLAGVAASAAYADSQTCVMTPTDILQIDTATTAEQTIFERLGAENKDDKGKEITYSAIVKDGAGTLTFEDSGTLNINQAFIAREGATVLQGKETVINSNANGYPMLMVGGLNASLKLDGATYQTTSTKSNNGSIIIGGRDGDGTLILTGGATLKNNHGIFAGSQSRDANYNNAWSATFQHVCGSYVSGDDSTLYRDSHKDDSGNSVYPNFSSDIEPWGGSDGIQRRASKATITVEDGSKLLIGYGTYFCNAEILLTGANTELVEGHRAVSGTNSQYWSQWGDAAYGGTKVTITDGATLTAYNNLAMSAYGGSEKEGLNGDTEVTISNGGTLNSLNRTYMGCKSYGAKTEFTVEAGGTANITDAYAGFQLIPNCPDRDGRGMYDAAKGDIATLTVKAGGNYNGSSLTLYAGSGMVNEGTITLTDGTIVTDSENGIAKENATITVDSRIVIDGGRLENKGIITFTQTAAKFSLRSQPAADIIITDGEVVNSGTIEGAITMSGGTFVAQDGSELAGLTATGGDIQIDGNVTMTGDLVLDGDAELIFGDADSIVDLGDYEFVFNGGSIALTLGDKDIEDVVLFTGAKEDSYYNGYEVTLKDHNGNKLGTAVMSRNEDGSVTLEAAAVPEPTTATLSLLALAALAARRRRK